MAGFKIQIDANEFQHWALGYNPYTIRPYCEVEQMETTMSLPSLACNA